MASLGGHIAVSEAVFSLPLFLLALSQAYSRNYLTVDWAVYLVILFVVLGAVGGAFFWFAFSLPLIKSRKNRKH
jgi:hypothetical protein